jgi:hypothetical protein
MTDELRSLQLRSLYEPALLLDEPWQRARENDPEADRVDHPARDVERARPRVFGGRAVRTFASDGPARRTAAATTSAFDPRSVRQANVQSSITTTRMISPGSARASLAPSARPDWPKSHFRGHARFNARSRDTCGRHRYDNTTSRAETPARSSAARAVCTNNSFAPSR